jgi:hypothetical protein
MAFSIDQFRANLQFGGARQNQFDVTMPAPPVAGLNSADFAFKCRSASIPEEQVGIIHVPYFGRMLKFAGDRTFTEWQVQVFNDEDWGLRTSFEQWSNALNGHLDNLRNPVAVLTTGYMVDAILTQYGKAGNVIQPAQYTMIGCWPVTVGPIQLAWDANDQIEIFDVTFAYQWWENAVTS